MLKKIKSFILVIICACTLGLCFAGSALAEEEKPAIRQLLTPTDWEVVDEDGNTGLNPGEIYTHYFDIYNTGTEQFDFRAYAVSYGVTDENYNIDFNAEGTYSQIKNWITFNKNVYTVAPGEHERVYFTIRVPYDVPAGGQYAILMSEIINNEDEGMIKSVNRIGMKLYAHINGETRSTGYGKIIENNINGFFLNPPISVSSLVKNEGNVHADAVYEFNVYPIFSDDPIYTAVDEEGNVPSTVVLPETSRFNTFSWQNSPALGIYRVVQKITFMGETSEVEKIVVICPIWLIFIVALVIAVLIARRVATKRTKNDKAVI